MIGWHSRERPHLTNRISSDASLSAARVVRASPTVVHYVLTDHFGSATVTVDDQGTTVIAELRYFAYGATRLSTGATPTERRYTGQLQQADVGLYYCNARWYSATLARFVSADTIVPAPENPQSLDRYSYGLNNSIKFTDPSGHAVACAEGPTLCGTHSITTVWKFYAKSTDKSIFADAYTKLYQLKNTSRSDPDYVDMQAGVAHEFQYAQSFVAQRDFNPGDVLDPGSLYNYAAKIVDVGSEMVAAAGTVAQARIFRGPAAQTFNWDHIYRNHSEWGAGAQHSRRKTVFTGLSASQIRARVEAAWSNRELLETQLNVAADVRRQRYRGGDPTSGQTVEFWYNYNTRTVETAYPVP